MSAPIADFGPGDGETVMINWLRPLRPDTTNNEREPGDGYPFCLVTQVAGTESEAESWSDPVIQVDTLCLKEGGQVAARDESDRTHRRILLLARTLEDVPLAGGKLASIDYVRVIEPPQRLEWGNDQVIRRMGRYQIGLAYD